jgi:hypothetical protein
MSRDLRVSPSSALPSYMSKDNFQDSVLLGMPQAWCLFRGELVLELPGAAAAPDLMDHPRRRDTRAAAGGLEFIVTEEIVKIEVRDSLRCSIVTFGPSIPGFRELGAVLVGVLEDGLIRERVLDPLERGRRQRRLRATASLSLSLSLCLTDAEKECVHLSARDAHTTGPRGGYPRFECNDSWRRRRDCWCRCGLLSTPKVELTDRGGNTRYAVVGEILAPVQETLRRMRNRAAECLRDYPRFESYRELEEKHAPLGCHFHRVTSCGCLDCCLMRAVGWERRRLTPSGG